MFEMSLQRRHYDRFLMKMEHYKPLQLTVIALHIVPEKSGKVGF
ncbi:hypothetical protein [Flammeovirga aprica]|nr:hypothetical protein [Flammeovirga aprica]